MWAEFFKIISIILLTMIKFIAGPTLGYAAGLSFFTTIIITIIGMMLSVFLFTFLGNIIRIKILDKIFKRKKVFSKRSRRFVSIWKNYGIKGVAFLTPLLLTPIGGTIILTSYHTSKRIIILYMSISALFWSITLTGIIYLFGPSVLNIIQ
jgi:membrane protein DedA with SNARE-associated domain